MVSSWGQVFKYPHQVINIHWSCELRHILQLKGRMLPYGLGRSYGDSCLNEGGNLVSMSGFDRFISADWQTGIVRCQAGMSLASLLEVAVPFGYFVPVSPGTKFITLGGAVANDVHGKNHHAAGTFGRHVLAFELLRSDGSVTVCTPDEHSELFNATIGGLGLTGVITWVELQMKPIKSTNIDVEVVKFEHFREFLEINHDSESRFEYTVAWFDCMHDSDRGHYIRGNHASHSEERELVVHRPPRLTMPFEWPKFALNPWSMKLFNTVYYNLKPNKKTSFTQHYEPFFYPLDAIGNWNKIYGKAGLYQYQFILPFGQEKTFEQILAMIRQSQQGSFLAVLKTFGSLPSPGLLSFPRPGITLSLDFKNHGPKTLELFKSIESLIIRAGGNLYPAKDSVMSKEAFVRSFPRLEEFCKYIDPQFSSSFWRRVMS